MTPPLGSGERFAALKSTLAHRSGVRNPGALAAFIGRKKYGNDRMEDMAEAGRKHRSPMMMKPGRARI